MPLEHHSRGASAQRQVDLSPYNAKRLFIGSCAALVVIGASFSIRGDIIGPLASQFSLSMAQMGWISGAAFWGYLLSILIGGQLCDQMGMGRLLALAFLAHVSGTLLTIFAGGFWQLWSGTLIIGVANAFIEAAVNPLIATVYPDRKTQKLNAVHAWFSWGIVVGGLASFLFTGIHFGWQAKMGIVLALTVLYGSIYLGQKFPPTERVQHGITTTQMYKETIRPQFLVWVFCMLLTAATELGPNQWIPQILTDTAALPGILVLVWINGLMAIGRMLAGSIVHRLSPIGVLVVAAALSSFGLVWLSLAGSAFGAFTAATLFAVGICYFWPTMLGITAERFPAGGALALAAMGAAGNLSVAIILPAIGRIYDVSGPRVALRDVGLLPMLLTILFCGMWLVDRARRQRDTRQSLHSKAQSS